LGFGVVGVMAECTASFAGLGVDSNGKSIVWVCT
jgi:hypothetical protein